MKDTYGREVKSLRLSVTYKCNLNCFYCHGEGQEKKGSEMSPEEIEIICKVANASGISKVKLTGGEPLLREDIAEIVAATAKYMHEVSITTNGILFGRYVEKLKESGLNRVNISLDTLNAAEYARITGKNCLSDVVSGIKAARANNIPTKINTVLLKGINETEIYDMIDFAFGMNATLQIIELELSKDSHYKRYYCKLEKIEKELEANAIKIEKRAFQNRKRYAVLWKNGIVEIELVKPMHNTEFCRNCTRLRVTADGKLKPCLFSNESYEFVKQIRNHASKKELLEIFKNAIVNRVPYWR